MSGLIFKICMSLPPNIGPDIEGFYSISKQRPSISTFLPLFATQYQRFVFDIGSDIEYLSGNIVHISISGTIIKSFLFDIECFINQHLPYIDIMYDIVLTCWTCPAGQVPELEVEAGGQPVESCGLIIKSQGHDRIKAHEKQSLIVMVRCKHIRNN